MNHRALLTAIAVMGTGCLQTSNTPDAGSELTCAAAGSITAHIAGQDVVLGQAAVREEDICTGGYGVDSDGGIIESDAGLTCEPGMCRFAFTTFDPCSANEPPASALWVEINSMNPCGDGTYVLGTADGVSVRFYRIAAGDMSHSRGETGTVEFRNCSATQCTVLLNAVSVEGDNAHGCFTAVKACKPGQPYGVDAG